MKVLLDTHAFVWWEGDIAQLSKTALDCLTDPSNEIILSTASLWEIQIKHKIGKLSLRLPLADIVATQQVINGIIVLPVMPTHIFALDNLPTPHKDPFDRLLVAQAIIEGAFLLSADPIFAAYPVIVIW